MKYSKNQTIILNLIKENKNITAIELQKFLELSETEFYNEVRELKQAGILKHVGLANDGTWVITHSIDVSDGEEIG